MKNIILSNELLKKSLKKLSGVIDKKCILPVAQNVLLKAGHKEVEIIATDLDVTTIITQELVADNEKAFSVLLPFDLLYRISSLTGDMPIQISIDGDKATIKADSDVYELNSLDAVKEFPSLPALPTTTPISFDAEFAVWLNSALATLSTDKLRPAMTRVCLDIKDSLLTIVTTNAHCLFVKAFQITEREPESVIMSPKVAKALVGFDNMELSWNENHLIFKCDQTTIVAKRCDDKYPAWRGIVPKFKPNVEFNRKDLIVTLEKVSLTTGFDNRINFLLNSGNGVVKIESSNGDGGRSSSFALTANYTGKCEMISVDVNNMINMLQQVHFDQVHLSIDQANKPILITAQSDESYTGLIMPLLSA